MGPGETPVPSRSYGISQRQSSYFHQYPNNRLARSWIELKCLSKGHTNHVPQRRDLNLRSSDQEERKQTTTPRRPLFIFICVFAVGITILVAMYCLYAIFIAICVAPVVVGILIPALFFLPTSSSPKVEYNINQEEGYSNYVIEGNCKWMGSSIQCNYNIKKEDKSGE